MTRVFVGVCVAVAGLVGAAEDGPKAVKGATYDATMLASLERIAAWEQANDRTNVVDGLTLGPWQVLGPFAPDDAAFAELARRGDRFDFAKPVVAGGRSFAWRAAPELADGRAHDLSGFRGDAKGGAYFIVRDVTCAIEIRAEGRKRLDSSFEAGTVGHWLPGRQGVSSGLNVFPEVDAHTWRLYRGPGAWQFAAAVPCRDGHARFYFHAFDVDEKSPAGGGWPRKMRRERLRAEAAAMFTSPADRRRIDWENTEGLWKTPNADFWFVPGFGAEGLARQYADAVSRIHAANPGLAPSNVTDFAALCALRDAATLGTALSNAVFAVADHARLFGADYPNAAAYTARIRELARANETVRADLLAKGAAAVPDAIRQMDEIERVRRTILLDTPFLRRHRLLVAKGNVGFASNWEAPNRIGEEIVLFDPNAATNACTTLVKSRLSDFDLHWDADRVLFSDGHAVKEVRISAPGSVRTVSKSDPEVNHYDVCYLPSGKILSACNACWQTVPCVGAWNVGNLHLMEADGSGERRITYDQDHSWNPTVMEDGNVMFTRWEYADIPHYFSRLVMRMKPDGTGQMEFYGSNSYWPNSMFWPRQIPGSPTEFVCIVSGHHGVNRAGHIYVFDTRKGRHEADGVVRRITGRDTKTEPIIKDQLVTDVWPKFAAPFPLAEDADHKGAGTYFLVSRQSNSSSGWDLCLADAFDNLTPILEARPGGNWMGARPVQERPLPRVIPDMVDTNRTDAHLYLVDIYRGGGLKGFPKGSIKALRLATFNYRHFGNGGTYNCAWEGGWDVKRVLGTVPVDADGSAFFRVPANTPVFVQPLDAEGKAQAVMRSWYNAMPGEVGSCVGCHEEQNSIPPVQIARAVKRAPSEITPFQGPARGFSFEAEIQPILSRRCVGCHDAKAEAEKGIPDFRDKRIRPDEQDKVPNECHFLFWLGNQLPHLKAEGPFFSPSYMRFQKYFRRAGLEADYHLLPPAEFEADTSILVRMLKKGHHGVTLTRGEWEAIYTWIDMNVPYCGRWLDSPCPPSKSNIDHRVKYKKLYANIDDHDEDPIPVPPIPAFEPPARPAAASAPKAVPFRVDGNGKTVEKRTLALPSGRRLEYAVIPSGEGMIGRSDGFADERPRAVKIARPFGLTAFEISNAVYAEFDPKHDSRYIEGRGKDRTSRGTPVNGPDQPVVRVTWHEAQAFCRWLSEKTGLVCTLPTEEEWEWAARAGHAEPFVSGTKPCAINLAGEEIRRWNYGRAERGYNDGAPFAANVGWGAANAWGLFNVNGNVAEWTASDYDADGRKVVRGGSWNDTAKFATHASRWRYEPYKGVYDVGFRVKVELAR